MTKMTHEKARRLLQQACQRYLDHHERPSTSYFYPWPHRFIQYIYDLENIGPPQEGTGIFFPRSEEQYDSRASGSYRTEDEHVAEYQFGQLLFRYQQTGLSRRANIEAPGLVYGLHNLVVLNRLLYHVVTSLKGYRIIALEKDDPLDKYKDLDCDLYLIKEGKFFYWSQTSDHPQELTLLPGKSMEGLIFKRVGSSLLVKEHCLDDIRSCTGHVLPESTYIKYPFALKTEGVALEKNTVYLSVRKTSEKTISRMNHLIGEIELINFPVYVVEYTVMDAGKTFTGQINSHRLFGNIDHEIEFFLKSPEEQLRELDETWHYRVLEITSKRGHTHNNESILRGLEDYRREHHLHQEISENTPLGWYVADQSNLGDDKQRFPLHEFKVIPPIDTTKRQEIACSKHLETVLLPYIASKEGSVFDVSVQYNQVLTNIRSLLAFMETLPRYQSGKKKERFNRLCKVFEEEFPLKNLAIKELKAILDDPRLSDEEALSAFELRLKDSDTMTILNRQSTCEYTLKLCSVISILVGVGIFTTLGLMFKRLYDSGGTSINFFKPLSKNLAEDCSAIAVSCKKSS